MAIATYKYFYGGGTEPNREISFIRSDESKPDSIQAQVKAVTPEGLITISTLTGNQIHVENMSTTEKIAALIAERDGKPASVFSDSYLAELTLKKQNDILKSLAPKGHWRIEICNDFGEDPSFEKVVQLTLFNPG